MPVLSTIDPEPALRELLAGRNGAMVRRSVQALGGVWPPEPRRRKRRRKKA